MTYAEIYRPASRSHALLYDGALILGGSLLVALAAQLAIPLWPVPVTGQTFAVLLVGALLGSKRGALALTSYLLEGAAGLPFFAEASGGLQVIAGPTGGYLVGFIAAAFVVGLLADHGWDRHMGTTALAMLAGDTVLYLFGLPWLARIVGLDNVLAYGLFPFLIGDAIKLALAVVTLPAGWRFIGPLPAEDA